MAITISADETYTLDGVTYTAVSDAVLNLDDGEKISGIASGSVTAVVSGAESSPTITFDATDGAITFTATSDGEIITSRMVLPLEIISGEFTFNGSALSISAGSEIAIVNTIGDFSLRNENTFVYDSTYTFSDETMTSNSERVISHFVLSDGTNTRELNLEQLGKVINNFLQRGFTLVQGSSEVMNIGDYTITATALNSDAGLNISLGTDGITLVPNSGDGALNVALSRDGREIFAGDLECTSGTITFGFDHAVTFAAGTSFDFTWNGYTSRVTTTAEATTDIALTDNGISFTPGTDDGGLNIVLYKDGTPVFGGALNVTDGTITFDATEQKFSFTEGTKIALAIGTDGSQEIDFEITGGNASFKVEADTDGNFTITPDTNDGSLSIALKQDGAVSFQNNVTVNGAMTINPVTDLLTLLDGTTVSLAFDNYTLTATAQGDAASKISLTTEGIAITPQEGDGKLNLVLSGANGTISVDVDVLSGGFFLGSDGSLKILEGTKTTLTLGDYEINLTADSDTTFGVSLGTDGTINITSPENNGSVDISIASGGSTIFNNTININGTVSFNPEDQTVNLTDGTKISLTLPDIEVRLDIEVADGDASGKISLNDGKFLYTPDEDGKALNIGLTLLQNDGTDFMTIPVNLETTNGSLGIDFVNKSFVFSKGNSFTINLGEYIVGAEIVDDDANISIESSGDGNFKITPGKDDGSIKVNLTRAADSQTIFASTVKIDGSISVEGTAGTLDAGTTVSITQGDYEINFTVTGDDGIVLAPYGTTGFILISPKSSNVALDASLKRNGEAILNGNLKLNRPIYYNPANNLFEMDSKTKFVTTIGNYEITLGTDSTLLVAYFNIEDDRFIITPLEGNRYNTAVVSIARDGTTIIDSLKIKLSEGSLIFDAANLSFGFGDGTEITTTFGDYNVTATAKGEARVSFAITDSGLTVTPASGDGTLDITLSKGDEELLTANVEVLSGAFILGENGTLTLKDGTATKITFGNYTLNVTAQGDATSTIAVRLVQ